MIFWRIFHRSIIFLVAVKLSAAIDLDEEAKKTIQVFCGNDAAVQKLDTCGKMFKSSMDTSYGTIIKNCSMVSSNKEIVEAVDYACKNKVAVGQCVVLGVPHETDSEIATLQQFHECIDVHITKQQIREFNEAIKQAQAGY